jgi:hypothetical protein
MEIRFVDDRSISPKAFDYLERTLKEMHSEELLNTVRNQLSRCAFVEFDEDGLWSRWIVLPDRKMVLFDFWEDKVLSWTAADFQTQTRFDTKDWHMAGALITPTGTIEIK